MYQGNISAAWAQYDKWMNPENGLNSRMIILQSNQTTEKYDMCMHSTASFSFDELEKKRLSLSVDTRLHKNLRICEYHN